MTLPRFALYCLGLLLLCLLGAAIYISQNLESLLGQQAKQYLQEFGVQDIDFEQLQLSGNRFGASRLWLRGERDGLAFEATLSSLVLDYNWRMLLNGQLQSVILSNLDIAVQEITASTKTAATAISVASLLPQPLIAQLPLQSLEIKKWNLEYRSPGLPLIAATGSLLIEEQLNLHLETSHLDSHIIADLWTGEQQSSLRAKILLRDGETGITELTVQLQRVAHDEWQWNLDAGLDYASVLAWLRRLDLETELALDIPELEGLILLGSSAFTAQIRHPDNLNLASEVGQPLLSQFNAIITVDNEITRLNYPATIEDLAGDVNIILKFDDGELELLLAPTELRGNVWTQFVSLPENTRDWLRWEQTIPLRWRSPEHVKISSTSDNGWSVQLRDNLLVLGNKDSQLRWEALNLDTVIYPGDQLQLNTEISTSIKTRLRKQQLPQMELAFTQQGSFEQSEFSVLLDDTAESISMSLQG